MPLASCSRCSGAIFLSFLHTQCQWRARKFCVLETDNAKTSRLQQCFFDMMQPRARKHSLTDFSCGCYYKHVVFPHSSNQCDQALLRGLFLQVAFACVHVTFTLKAMLGKLNICAALVRLCCQQSIIMAGGHEGIGLHSVLTLALPLVRSVFLWREMKLA